MKTAIPKTEEEMKQEAHFTPIKSGNYVTRFKYWQCHDCHVLFEQNDTVLMKTLGDDTTLACPLTIREVSYSLPRFLTRFELPKVTERTCKNTLYGGDRAWYESRYKISEYEPKA